MGVLGRIRAGRIALIGAAVAAVFMVGYLGQGIAQADNAASLSLSVSGCDSDVCNLDTGESFTLTVNADDAPNDGYVLVQTFIDYGSNLTYNMADAAADEVVWPDVSSDVIVRDSIADGTMLIGGLTGVVPPLPVSTYEGPVFELSFTCSDSYSSTEIMQVPSGTAPAGTSGATFSNADGQSVVPKVSNVTVNCGEAPTPGPTEGGPTALPPTGSGALGADQGGSNLEIWLAIAALFAAGVLGIGAFTWNAARSRRD